MSSARPGRRARKQADDARQPRLLYLVKRWYAATRTRLDEITRPYDLTAGDYTMLSFLKRLQPCSAAELSREQRITPQAATQQLAQLKAKKMVTSEENQANRRISLISMTPSGRASLAAISAEARLLEEEMMKGLSERDRAVVIAFLIGSIETAEEKRKTADGQ
jgi:DNA-binding MarR family transcriptional regulator